jgi:ankyrin repeat protein
LQVVKEFLEHGADIEARTLTGRTPLHVACAHGHHVAVVNELLSPNDSNDTTTSILGKRKSRGADIEAKGKGGNTPLHFASWGGNLAVVNTLLSGSANILAASIDGELPNPMAVRFGNSEVTKYLLQQLDETIRHLPLHELLEDLTFDGTPNIIPPLRAALGQNVLGTDDVVEMVEYLVDRNPELFSSRDQDCSLPLHLSCRRGASFAIVQSLVNLFKASVKSLTSQGDLPLFLACELSEPSLDTIFLWMKLYPRVVSR